MSRRRANNDRLPSFVPLFKETLATPAWRAMSPYARLVYVALKTHHIKNNGRVYLAVRKAAEETGLNKNTVARAFRELQHYGFIVMTEAGCLGVDGKGKAPHWRLTELPYLNELATKDYLRWDGSIFQRPKKQNPVPSEQTECPVRQDITVSRPTGQLAPDLSRPAGHTADPPCPVRQDITSLATRGGRAGAVEADADLAGIGHNAGPPLDDLEIPGFLRRVSVAVPDGDRHG